MLCNMFFQSADNESVIVCTDGDIGIHPGSFFGENGQKKTLKGIKKDLGLRLFSGMDPFYKNFCPLFP